MNPIDEQLQKLGYSEIFYQDSDRWGFLNDAVMPAPIPQEIIKQAVQQDKRDRLADWPSFSRWQRFRFWCDRISQNRRIKRNYNSGALKVGNVKLPSERLLVLGHPILHFSILGHSKYSGTDVFYSLRSQLRLDINDVDTLWPSGLRFAPPHHLEGDYWGRIFSISDKPQFRAWTQFNTDVGIWVICSCDRDLAEVVAKETGCPAHYFYALPSHQFWVYFKCENRLVLGELENPGSIWAVTKQVITLLPSMYSRQTRWLSLLCLVLILIPKSLIQLVLLILAFTMFLYYFLKDQLRNQYRI